MWTVLHIETKQLIYPADRLPQQRSNNRSKITTFDRTIFYLARETLDKKEVKVFFLEPKYRRQRCRLPLYYKLNAPRSIYPFERNIGCIIFSKYVSDSVHYWFSAANIPEGYQKNGLGITAMRLFLEHFGTKMLRAADMDGGDSTFSLASGGRALIEKCIKNKCFPKQNLIPENKLPPGMLAENDSGHIMPPPPQPSASYQLRFVRSTTTDTSVPIINSHIENPHYRYDNTSTSYGDQNIFDDIVRKNVGAPRVKKRKL